MAADTSNSLSCKCSGASNDNTDNAIVFGHSGLEWSSVDAPAALGSNGPWAAAASTLGHSRPYNALRNSVIGILIG